MQEAREKIQTVSFFRVNDHLQNWKANKRVWTYKRKQEIKSNIPRKYDKASSISMFVYINCMKHITSATAYLKSIMEKVKRIATK